MKKKHWIFPIIISLIIVFLIRSYGSKKLYLGNDFFDNLFKNEKYEVLFCEHYNEWHPCSLHIIKLTEPFKTDILNPETYEEGIPFGFESELNARYNETIFPDDVKSLVLQHGSSFLLLFYSEKKNCYWLYYCSG